MFSRRRDSFQYEPLPQRGYIRLLELRRRSGLDSKSPIFGHLITTSINEAPSYYALSYTWGTNRKSVRLSLDGQDFWVTPNLGAALKRLDAQLAQNPFSPRIASSAQSFASVGMAEAVHVNYIWVDQICIDQANVVERGDQVPQMNAIYDRSERTLIWLGEDGGFAKEALQLLELVDRVCIEETTRDGSRVFLTYNGKGAIDWDRHESWGLPAIDSPQWKAMNVFLSFPWFRRVWIVQEVVLSRRNPVIMVGQELCSWTMVAWASHWLYNEGYIDGFVPQSVRCTHMLLRMRLLRLDYDVDALALMAMSHFATDPRDKVYGLLGLEAAVKVVAYSSYPRKSAAWEFAGGGAWSASIRPQYSIPPSATCEEWMRHMIAKSKSLAILSLPTTRPSGCWDVYRYFGRQSHWRGYQSWFVPFEDVPRPRHFVNFYPDNDYGSVAVRYHRDICVQPETSSYATGTKFRAAEGLQLGPISSEHHSARGPLKIQGIKVDKVKVFLPTSPWEGLAKQNRFITKSTLLDGSRWWRYHLKERQHWGKAQLLYYILHAQYVGVQRPYALRIWEAALQHSRYENPLDVADAVLHATTASMDAAYQPWAQDGLASFCAFMVAVYDRWAPRRASSRVHLAYQTLLECSQRMPGDAQKYAVAMQYWCGLRRFFVTERGYIGIGPTSIRKGDAVCVLAGGGVPFVLRSHKEHWYLVGDCYVHELGEGQAVEAWQRGELEKETFEIR